MKVRRVTIRRLMVAVAMVAGMMGFVLFFGRRAEAFRLKSDRLCIDWMNLCHDDQDSPHVRSRGEYLGRLTVKYRYAARHPWLPVPPDPPEPK